MFYIFLTVRQYNNTYKWIIWSDDDTAIFMPAMKRLLRFYDPELPYAISGGWALDPCKELHRLTTRFGVQAVTATEAAVLASSVVRAPSWCVCSPIPRRISLSCRCYLTSQRAQIAHVEYQGVGGHRHRCFPLPPAHSLSPVDHSFNSRCLPCHYEAIRKEMEPHFWDLEKEPVRGMDTPGRGRVVAPPPVVCPYCTVEVGVVGRLHAWWV